MTLFRFKQETIVSIGVVSFIIAVTAALPLTSAGMRGVSEGVRIFALFSLFMSFLMLTIKFRLQPSLLVSVVAFTSMFSYGSLLAVIYGGHLTALQVLPVTFVVVSVGLVMFSQRRMVIGPLEAKILVIYFAVFFLLTVALGGFRLEFPPGFLFEVQTGNHGSIVSYGQGVTKFFGLGAILTAFLGSHERRTTMRWVLTTLMLMFLVLSLMGGARGDAIATVLTISLLYSLKTPIRLIVFVCIALLFATLFISVEDFILLRRLELLMSGGGLGAREELYADAVGLLSAQPRCVMFGCGFDYYQAYYGLSAGLYPHNFLLEFLITFGAPLTSFLLVGFLIGLVRSLLTRDGIDGFLLIVIYFTLIYLKSGSVISGWLFVTGLFYYFGIGVQIIAKKTGIQRYADV